MPTNDIIQTMISELGQSQPERKAPELEPHFADVDERTPEDLLEFLRAFAEYVWFYPTDGGAPSNWTSFFPDSATTETEPDGKTPPHAALLSTFLSLHERQRAVINENTLNHLHFQLEDVLRFQKRALVPDHVHVVVDLKKNTAPVRVPTTLGFSAGKDATNSELLYQPARETVVSTAKVDALSAVFVDGPVYVAPVANSGDGVGGELEPTDPGWESFGTTENAPPGVLGFALSTPVLRMAEGDRTVTVSLTLADGDAATAVAELDGALSAYLTGAEAWLGPYEVTLSESGSDLRLTVHLSTDDLALAVTDYDAAIHQGAFAANGPVVQFLVKSDAAFAFREVQGLTVQSARISVDVKGITSLTLENDTATLDPKKAFTPFGAEAVKGARFMIGCTEALSKKLDSLSVTIRWHALPDLADTYEDYGGGTHGPSSFKASASFQDASGNTATPKSLPLFPAADEDPQDEVQIDLTPGAGAAVAVRTEAKQVYILGTAGSLKARVLAETRARVRPFLKPHLTKPPELRPGFITLALEKGFLHDVFRKKTVENAMNHKAGSDPAFKMLNEPYTPAIEAISLEYSASTDTAKLDSPAEDDFANAELRFFQVDAFGQRQDHAYLRTDLEYVTDKRVPLFPEHPDDGELFVGISGLSAGDSVSLLVQIAEGSANPDMVEWPEVKWSVLCDNYWRALAPGELSLDTTRSLRASGLVAVVVPAEATTENTLLSTGRLWLKASVAEEARHMPKLVEVAANGVELVFVDQGNDPARLDTPLAAGAITKTKTPIAAAQTIAQKYPSFGGRPVESDDALRTRAPERLRHKDRCITAWDYERIVLEAFPEIHRVKCVPHASNTSWLAPGNVLLVVVPDLDNPNSPDLLRPRANPDTLDSIGTHVRARTGGQTTVSVKNPTYQKIRLDFGVRFLPDYAPNVYVPALVQEIIEFLSPWAYATGKDIAFGGRIYKSVLLQFVEERPYVDYVTSFKMYTFTTTAVGAPDVMEAVPETPDVIFVSDETHIVTPIA